MGKYPNKTGPVFSMAPMQLDTVTSELDSKSNVRKNICRWESYLPHHSIQYDAADISYFEHENKSCVSSSLTVVSNDAIWRNWQTHYVET